MSEDRPNFGFTFGSLNLLGDESNLATDGYWFTALGTDGDFGNGEPIDNKVTSWLQDGAIIARQGYDTRDMYLKVMVSANSGDDLARGEQALMLETGIPNLLTYTPADASAAACVFSVEMSTLEYITNEQAELSECRIYGLRIQALPFVRGTELITVAQPAPPSGGPTVVSIDTCTSTTGWDGDGQTVTTSGGAVRVQRNGGISFFPGVSLMNNNYSQDMTSTKYLRVDFSYQMTPLVKVPPYFVSVSASSAEDGFYYELKKVAENGTVRWYEYDPAIVGGPTLTGVWVQFQRNVEGPAVLWKLWINDISRTDSLVDSGVTNRQLSRTLPILGSARGPGSLAIEDETNALGSVLVYTTPSVDGSVQPNIRTWLSSGNTQTPDSATVSGKTSDLATLHTFDIPVDGLIPGGHLLLARVKHASSGNHVFTWAAKTRQGSTTISGGQSGSTTVALTAGTFSIVTLARLDLPPRKLGPNGVVRIELTSDSGVVLDEAWLFNVEVGRLSQFEAGTSSPSAGGSANRAWLDAPTLDSPQQALYVGTAADRSDSYHLENGIRSMPVHEFKPGLVSVFTVTSNATEAAITHTGYPWFFTYAAKVA